MGFVPGWDSPKTVANVHSFAETLETIALAVAIILEIFGLRITSDVAWVVLVIADATRWRYGARDNKFSEADKQQKEEQLEALRLRASEAEKVLVDLRLERILRTQLFDGRKFVGVLSDGPKATIEILYAHEDGEACEFADVLARCFAMAGWNIPNMPSPIPPAPHDSIPGILLLGARPLGITVRANGPIEGPFKAVVDAFKAIEERSLQYRIVASGGNVDFMEQGLVRIIVGPRM
jgi:hypothetical protein